MAIYATFQAFYITFNTFNFYIYVIDCSCIVSDVSSISIYFYISCINTFAIIYDSLCISINFNIYVVDCSNIISNVSSVSIYFYISCIDTFAIIYDSLCISINFNVYVINCCSIFSNISCVVSNICSIIFYFTIDISNLFLNIVDNCRGLTYLTF